MNIKLTNWLLLGTLCLTAAAQADTADTPQDFAYGMPLITDNSSPFFRVDLPREVYEQATNSDLRDVRVFNNQGMTVPFALSSNVATEKVSHSYTLRVFTLDAKKDTARDRPMISLKSASGVEVKLPNDEDHRVGRKFLLEVPKEGDNFPNLNGLKLEWTRLPQNWQARVSVLYSHDLHNWDTLLRDVPLMDLTSGADRLLLNDIDWHRSDNTSLRSHYVLLMLDDTAPAALNITSAQGVVELSNSEQHRIVLNAQAKPISSNEAEYTWPSPQLMSQLNVTPEQQNTVLPLEIEYRSSATDDWHPLAQQMVYRLNDRKSPPLMLHGQLVQAVRLKGVNQQWNENLPQVSGARDAISVVFNAQGSTPFLLAWGNKVATAQAIDIRELIPQEMQLSVDSLPIAQLQPMQSLGGPERLTAPTSTEKTGMWQKGILWAMLILGAGGLVLLALKIWREVQQQNE